MFRFNARNPDAPRIPFGEIQWLPEAEPEPVFPMPSAPKGPGGPKTGQRYRQFVTTFEAATILSSVLGYVGPTWVHSLILSGHIPAKAERQANGKTRYRIDRYKLIAVARDLPLKKDFCSHDRLAIELRMAPRRLQAIMESLGIQPTMFGDCKYYPKALIDARRTEIEYFPKIKSGRRVRDIMGLVKGGR